MKIKDKEFEKVLLEVTRIERGMWLEQLIIHRTKIEKSICWIEYNKKINNEKNNEYWEEQIKWNEQQIKECKNQIEFRQKLIDELKP